MIQSYSLKDIQNKLKSNNLPSAYRINTPCTIFFKDLLSTLRLFKDEQQMLNFISTISHTFDVSLVVRDKTLKLGSIIYFIEAYTTYNLFPRELTSEKQHIILNYFKKNLLFKEQISYLMKNLNITLLRKLMNHCFDKNLLLEVANDYRYISSFDPNINRMLYLYLNPQPEKSLSTSFPAMYYWATRAGHALGLSNAIEFQIQGKKHQLDPTYAYDQESLMLLIESLESYFQTYPSDVINTILNAFKFCYELMNPAPERYKQGAQQVLFLRYQQGLLTYIASCGWHGHTVGIAFFGNYLICCNRGDGGDQRFGCKIFAIKNLNYVTGSLFKMLIEGSRSSDEFYKILRQIVDLKHPIAQFHSKGQKHNNCTFADLKAIIEGMLAIVPARLWANPDELFSTDDELNRQKYKHITNFIRNREIHELLKHMVRATHPDLIQFFAGLTCSIIKEHHGKNSSHLKNINEVKRAKHLFANVPNEIKNILIKDTELMQIMSSLSEKKQQKTPLFSYNRLPAQSPMQHLPSAKAGTKESEEKTINSRLR